MTDLTTPNRVGLVNGLYKLCLLIYFHHSKTPVLRLPLPEWDFCTERAVELSLFYLVWLVGKLNYLGSWREKHYGSIFLSYVSLYSPKSWKLGLRQQDLKPWNNTFLSPPLAQVSVPVSGSFWNDEKDRFHMVKQLRPFLSKVMKVFCPYIILLCLK